MKVLFVATVVKTHILQFHIPYLEMFKQMGWQTAVAARNDYERPEDCRIPFCDDFYDLPFQRNPFHLDNLRAYRSLKKIIREGDYDLIHCHTPVGGMIARLAAVGARKKGTKVFYTAHGFHFYRGAKIINWLAYYPAEYLLSYLTDVLITINQEDYVRAGKMHAKHVEYIPGVGVDLERFQAAPSDRRRKRDEFGLELSDFLILSVGELIPRKNHALVLEAMNELRSRGEIERVHYLICGQGVLREDLENRVRELGLEEHVHFLGYRNDIAALCSSCDVFVFMSLQEGLPVALMEAMACGLPVICSRIRGNTDLVKDDENGILADSTPAAVADAVLRLRNHSALRARFASEARKTIQPYGLDSVRNEMRKRYEQYL